MALLESLSWASDKSFRGQGVAHFERGEARSLVLICVPLTTVKCKIVHIV